MKSKMRSRTGERAAAFSPIMESPPADKAAEWEVRPGGMLVQKRDPDADAVAAPVPAIRIKVKYGAVYHEIYISSQATFGELKKVLSARTGLHPLDMKLMYKDKERVSTAFLDIAGVKDKSKMVLVEDSTAQAKRLLEMRKTDKMEKAAKCISAISLEVDRLASKVSALDGIVNKGGRVEETDVTNLIDSLMNELIKLDAIVADGDAKLQRRTQIRRVQKYVETLDAIKIKNWMPRGNGPPAKEQPQWPQPMQQRRDSQPQQQQQKMHLQQSQNQYQHQNRHQPPQSQFQQQQQLNKLPQQAVVLSSMNWETFDSLFTTSTSTPTAVATSTPHARLDWELF
ncbi:BAG domain-containing protein [Musa troglodytarum]|uniref:BAG domain-containing protein n=1 Tax=Musa troglodytarum TaxID=320322 RepID=A0A9E7FH26_9LILI|nr:BAG domain-containing protein [Musa troglodytarum]